MISDLKILAVAALWYLQTIYFNITLQIYLYHIGILVMVDKRI